MAVLNRMDRFHLALDVDPAGPAARRGGGWASERCREALQRHKLYVSEHGEDLPEVKDWTWTLS